MGRDGTYSTSRTVKRGASGLNRVTRVSSCVIGLRVHDIPPVLIAPTRRGASAVDHHTADSLVALDQKVGHGGACTTVAPATIESYGGLLSLGDAVALTTDH